MKIKQINDLRVILAKPESYHNYFGWPTVCRLKNGRLALGMSAFRLSHVCPFGKSALSVSEDEGKTWSSPAPVIDTVLDDRDVGLCPFGKSGLIFTSFNNSADYQRSVLDKYSSFSKEKAYRSAYLEMITKEDEEKYLGSTFRISYDNGVTYGPVYKSPVTSPHGPAELSDGTVLWLGRTSGFSGDRDAIKAYTLDTDNGKMEYVGEIEAITVDGEKMLSCEPHAIQTKNGRIICHIRVQHAHRMNGGKMFTVFQSVSDDLGKTWTKPVQLIDDTAGAPPHLYTSSKGVLMCVYAKREEPYCIRAIFSTDGGETWSDEQTVCNCKAESPDHGYPSTVELDDGSFITIFYAKETVDGPAVIWQQNWRLED